MRVAILSDIHGNKDALDAVVKDIPEDVGDYWCLGDTIGYGPEPRECVAFVKSVCSINLKGNHEDMVLTPAKDLKWRQDVRDETQWTREILEDNDIYYLECLPDMWEKNRITLVHGGFPDHVWSYIHTSQDALRGFGFFKGICFYGHTHVPAIWGLAKNDEVLAIDPKFANGPISFPPGINLLINVGSVGQSRDRDNRASYVLFDEENEAVEFRRVEYDYKETERKVKEAGLPPICGTRLAFGR